MTDPQGNQAPLDGSPQAEASEPPPPAEPAERYPFWGYRDVALLVVLGFFVQVAAGVGAVVVFQTTRVNAYQALAVTFLTEAVWLALLFGVLRAGYGQPFWRSLGWIRPNRSVWTCVVWGVITAVVTVALGSVLPRPTGKNPLEDLLQGRMAIAMVGLFAVTLGPLFEELAFRGFLMPLLVRTFGSVAGVLLQAVPFAALHGVEYAWAWQQLSLMFLAGSAFGWMRYRTGSTAASTYMHAGYNLVAVVGILAQSFLK